MDNIAEIVTVVFFILTIPGAMWMSEQDRKRRESLESERIRRMQ
jgi:hypothetical protein